MSRISERPSATIPGIVPASPNGPPIVPGKDTAIMRWRNVAVGGFGASRLRCPTWTIYFDGNFEIRHQEREGLDEPGVMAVDCTRLSVKKWG